MGYKQIRIGQLIAPFGPGSIYTDRRGIPHVVAGIDHWFMRWDETTGVMIQCSNRAEFERFEPRLSAILRVDRFCSPPDYRHVSRGEIPPPNANLHIPAVRFPRWYRHTRTGEMRRFNLESVRLPKPTGGGRWQPVRFIAVCSAGHLCEFPWKQWIGCNCEGDGSLFLTDRGGSELTSIRVECRSCPQGSPGRKGRHLGGTTFKPDIRKGEESAFQKAGINCPGDRPWLGEGSNEPDCPHPLVGALINQTNIYFPRTISAISLPDIEIQDEAVSLLRIEIEQDPSTLGVGRTLWNMGKRGNTVAMVAAGLDERGVTYNHEQIEAALQSLFEDEQCSAPAGSAKPAAPESELLAFRRAEFNIIRNEINDPEHIPDLRVIQVSVPQTVTSWIYRVNLVERLRETRAFYGFDRLDTAPAPLVGMPQTATNQLFRDPPRLPQDRWLPVVEVFGEGIYIELDENQIAIWQAEQAAWLENRLDDGFIVRLGGIYQTLPPLGAANRAWASKYLLVHTMAHVLINQFVFECGYSTASLRERIYVSTDEEAPMASLLIYTAAGDSDGTLGGLVQLGRPDRLGQIIHRALSRASWCSADPVCSEHLGGQGSRLVNLAACHACVLLPETSCETINHGLDRGMLVGTPYRREGGFMSALLTELYSIV
ncbi:MAG: DUF1998 domain-containing protein [Deltaproteobacteria bacterium]|nr:DUF1998 domain-containing protein [Deltaproteobacteria bacterium]